MKQGDTFFVNEGGDRAILQCHCGSGHFHGQIEFASDPGDSYGRGPDEDWFRSDTCYVQVYLRGAANATFWQRLKMSWLMLRGQAVYADLEFSRSTLKDFGSWCHGRVELAEKTYELGTTRTLKERMVKEKMEAESRGAGV